jgi:hypothetical protein
MVIILEPLQALVGLKQKEGKSIHDHIRQFKTCQMILSEYRQLNISFLLIPMQSPNPSQIGPILRKLQTKENQPKYKKK